MHPVAVKTKSEHLRTTSSTDTLLVVVPDQSSSLLSMSTISCAMILPIAIVRCAGVCRMPLEELEELEEPNEQTTTTFRETA
jgi:hypothetical protein